MQMKKNGTHSTVKMANELRGLCAVITKVARRDHEQLLGRHQTGIYALEHGVLRRLAHQKATLAELGRLMGITPSTLVYVIDGLVRKELVVREQDRRDRRRQPLSLTAQGQNLLEAIPEMDTESALVQSLTSMSERNRIRLQTLLRTFVKGLRDAEEWIPEFQRTGRSGKGRRD
jgi:DNA-binding MarR family transcriptional regulator